jgi:uncharacterized protein (DUF2461 family)
MRHAPFAVTTASAERWLVSSITRRLYHMRLAMQDVNIQPPDLREAMDEFFHDVAMFLRNTEP